MYPLRPFFLTLLLSFSALSFAEEKHEFYISLSEVRYNLESECYELSLRIFPDDMDRVLEVHNGIRTQLVTELEHALADSLLADYLLNVFLLVSNGDRVKLTYLGKEAEADVMWCYMESEALDEPSRIGVDNALLCEVFEDQVNVVQVYVGKWNRGLLLKRGQSNGELEVDPSQIR